MLTNNPGPSGAVSQVTLSNAGAGQKTSPHNELTGFDLTPSLKLHLVVVSGAGISAESGLSTFRGATGLWEGVSINDVATRDAWQQQPSQVLEFYNQRRRDVLNAEPNAAHKALVELERFYDVTIITQNVDDLHERAGSSRVIHLHGEILNAQSTYDASLVVPWKEDLHVGQRCPYGSQLRPNVVLFGEKIYNLENALSTVRSADFLVVVGTSLKVYPAAGILHEAPRHATKFLVDPSPARSSNDGFEILAQPASTGIQSIARRLTESLTEQSN